MGASESKFRISQTVHRTSPWVGFCTVVSIDEFLEELVMPNGDKHKFVFTRNGLRITQGEHKGDYKVENIYSTYLKI